ncbi:MAG: cytoskeleton protein RodZ [Paraglaciecola sp.]|jgi:cytoskeleton protein RodZ
MSEVQQPQVPQLEVPKAPQVDLPKAMGPGELLKNARLARDLSLEQIGSRIHLKVSLLVDLEKDHYDQAISMTFIKGYLKFYARQVGVTEAEILDALDTLNMHKEEPAKLQSFSRRVADQANDDKLMMVTYFILAAVVALVVVWWFQQDSKDPMVIEPQISADTPVQSAVINDAATHNTASDEAVKSGENDMVIERFVPQPATPLPQPVEKIAPTDVDDSSPIPVDESPEPQSVEQLPSFNSTVINTAVQEQQKVQLVFEFADDCWMSLTDATGEDIAYGVKVAGRVMTVSGVPPFKVILGAPGGVKINYSGKDLDLSKFNTGYTAEFSLPLIQ